MQRLTADQGAFVYFKAIVFNLVLQLVFSIVYSLLPVSSEYGVTVQLAFMALIQVAFMTAARTSTAKHGRVAGYEIAPVKWWAIALGFVLAPVSVLAFAFPANMFSLALEELGYVSQTALDFTGSGLNIALAFLVTVVIAPICEEYVFRGALLGALVKKRGAFVSCVLCAAAFAFMHMNPEQTIYQFFLGFCAAYLTVCSRSVLPAIALHGGNNLIAVLVEVFPIGDGGGTAFGAGAIVSCAALTLGGAAAFYFAGRLIAKAHGGFGGLTDEFKVEALSDEKAAEDALSGVGESGGVCVACGEKTDSDVKKCPVCGKKTRSAATAPPILGKRTATIVYCVTIGICAFMWIITFAASII